jgi:hypothetical protein
MGPAREGQNPPMGNVARSAGGLKGDAAMKRGSWGSKRPVRTRAVTGVTRDSEPDLM